VYSKIFRNKEDISDIIGTLCIVARYWRQIVRFTFTQHRTNI